MTQIVSGSNNTTREEARLMEQADHQQISNLKMHYLMRDTEEAGRDEMQIWKLASRHNHDLHR